MELAFFGLALIILGWLVQLVYMWQRKKTIQPWFLVIYICGVALLAVDGFMAGLTMLAWLNLISLAVALLVLSKLVVKK